SRRSSESGSSVLSAFGSSSRSPPASAWSPSRWCGPSGGRRGGRAGPRGWGPGSVRASLEDVLHRHMFVTMFFGLGSGTIFAFLPTFAEDLGATTLSLFYTAYSLAALAIRVAGGRLIDTHGRRAV